MVIRAIDVAVERFVLGLFIVGLAVDIAWQWAERYRTAWVIARQFAGDDAAYRKAIWKE